LRRSGEHYVRHGVLSAMKFSAVLIHVELIPWTASIHR
jgi:hypothetical protein